MERKLLVTPRSSQSKSSIFISKGSFGEVYKGFYKASGEIVAIKMIDLEAEMQYHDGQIDAGSELIQAITQEIQFLVDCSGDPHITKLFESFIQGTKLFVVMEYVGGGSVKDAIKRCGGSLKEVFIAIIIREVLLGVDFLHSRGKIHRDIKCANILIATNGDVKLADFGVSAQLSDSVSKRSTIVGTPCWMAPEIIIDNHYDFKCDLWSIGITAIEMAQGEPPYSDLKPIETFLALHHADPPKLNPNEHWSAEFRDFISLCLRKDPKLRPSAPQLLTHKFIRNAKKTCYLTELLEFQDHVQFTPKPAEYAPQETQLSPKQSGPSNRQRPEQHVESKYNVLKIDHSAAKEISMTERSIWSDQEQQQYESELNQEDFDVEVDFQSQVPNKELELNTLIANGWNTASDMLASSSRRRINNQRNKGSNANAYVQSPTVIKPIKLPPPVKLLTTAMEKLGTGIDEHPSEEEILAQELPSQIPGSSGGSYSGPHNRRKPQNATFGKDDANSAQMLAICIGKSIGLQPEQSNKVIGPALSTFLKDLQVAGDQNELIGLQDKVAETMLKLFKVNSNVI